MVEETINNLLAEDRDLKAQLRKQLHKLESQEDRLIELATSGTLSIAKIRERLERTTLQKDALQEKLEQTADRLQYGADTALAFLDLLKDPGELYLRAADQVRRDLISAYFDRLVVRVVDDVIRLEGERNQLNIGIRLLERETGTLAEADDVQKYENPRLEAGVSSAAKPSRSSAHGSFVHGSSNTHVAGMEGFEPPNAGTRTRCLTTWRHPNTAPREISNRGHYSTPPAYAPRPLVGKLPLVGDAKTSSAQCARRSNHVAGAIGHRHSCGGKACN